MSLIVVDGGEFRFKRREDIRELTPPRSVVATDARIEFIELQHPGHPNNKAIFALGSSDQTSNVSNDDKLTLLELHEAKSDSESASAFVGNTVRKVAILYMLTKMDIHLILASLLEAQNGRTVPISQLLRVEGYPHYHKLSKCKGLDWNLIADVNGSDDDDMILVKLNDEKLLDYLLQKVDRTATHLKSHELSKLECGGTSSTFNGPSAGGGSSNAVRAKILDKEAERLAIQITSEYLPPRWKEKLAQARSWTLKQINATEAYRPESDSHLTESAAHDEQTTAKPLSWEEAHGYAIQLPSVDHLRFGTRQPSANGGVSTSSAASNASSSASADTSASKRLKPSSVPLTSAQKKIAQVKDKRGVQSISSFFGKKAE